MEGLFRNPKRVVLFVLAGSVLGFFGVGFLASVRHLVIDWGAFRLGAALAFLAAFAQLVLALAVWFQLRVAWAAIEETKKGAAAADTERRADIARRRKQDRAGALLQAVENASNASALYSASFSSLRSVANAPGDQAAIARAERDLQVAEERRQGAHAARLRVQALCGAGAEATHAAKALVDVVDSQRRRGVAVLGWARDPNRPHIGPDPLKIYADPDAQRERCLKEAGELLG